MYCAMSNVISCVFPVVHRLERVSGQREREAHVPAVPPSKYLPSTGVSHAGSEHAHGHAPVGAAERDADCWYRWTREASHAVLFLFS